MEKSSYCCCYSHGHFNTGERNFHLSAPHSSPRSERHTSPLRLKSNLQSSAAQNLKISARSFSDALNVKPRRQVTKSSFPILTKCEAAWGIPGISNVSLELFDTEAPNRDAPQGNRGRGGRTAGRANSLTLQHYTVSGRKNTVTALHEGFTWPRLNPACLPPHGQTDESSWRGYICTTNYSFSVQQNCVWLLKEAPQPCNLWSKICLWFIRTDFPIGCRWM